MKITSSEGKRKADTVITEFLLFCLFVRSRFLGLIEFRESVSNFLVSLQAFMPAYNAAFQRGVQAVIATQTRSTRKTN